MQRQCLCGLIMAKNYFELDHCIAMYVYSKNVIKLLICGFLRYFTFQRGHWQQIVILILGQVLTHTAVIAHVACQVSILAYLDIGSYFDRTNVNVLEIFGQHKMDGISKGTQQIDGFNKVLDEENIYEIILQNDSDTGSC